MVPASSLEADSEAVCSGFCAQHCHSSVIVSDIPSLDRQIQYLQRLLVPVQRRRNSLLTFSSLPFDIRRRIFHLCSSLSSRDAAPGQFTLSRVCWSWRKDVVGDPLLWNTIRLHSGSISQSLEYFRRSQDAPISLVVDAHAYVPPRSAGRSGGPGSLTRALLHILGHADRIRMLALTCPRSWYLQMLEPALLSKGFCFRDLESLSVQFINEHPMAIMGGAAPDVHNPLLPSAERLLSGSRLTGNLRRLALSGASLAWDNVPDMAFRSLTHLTLIPDKTSAPFMQEIQWRSVLGCLRALVSLDLNVSAVPILTSKPELAPITLPALARLHLTGPPIDSVHFLKGIHLPETLAFSYTGSNMLDNFGLLMQNTQPSDVPMLLTFLGETFFGGGAADPECIIIEHSFEAETDMISLGTHPGPEVVLKGRRRSARLMISAEELCAPPILEFQRHINVAHILTSRSSQVMHTEDRLITGLLPALSNVRELHVAVQHACRVLAGDTLPSLSELHLCTPIRWRMSMQPSESSTSRDEDPQTENYEDPLEMLPAWADMNTLNLHLITMEPDDDPLLEAIAARKHTLRTVHLDSRTEYSAGFVAGMRNLGLQVVVTDEEDSYS
jgi:hypothetical protein